MTTTAPAPTALDVMLAPALARYTAELEAHREAPYVYGEPARCECGFTGKTNSRDKRGARSVGLHRGAAERRASKAYDVEAAAVLEQLGRMTSEDRRRVVAEHLAATETPEPAPVVEPELARGLGTLTAQLRAHVEEGAPVAVTIPAALALTGDRAIVVYRDAGGIPRAWAMGPLDQLETVAETAGKQAEAYNAGRIGGPVELTRSATHLSGVDGSALGELELK